MNRAGPLVVMVAAAAISVGCYSYVPVPPGVPGPGSRIRADVDDRAAAELTSVLGPGVQHLNGLVLARDEQSVSLLVESYRTQRNAELSGGNDPVRLPIDRITRVEQKRLARGRSVLLGAAFIGGAIALTEIFGGSKRVLESDDPDDPGPMQMRGALRGAWTLLRVRVP